MGMAMNQDRSDPVRSFTGVGEASAVVAVADADHESPGCRAADDYAVLA